MLGAVLVQPCKAQRIIAHIVLVVGLLGRFQRAGQIDGQRHLPEDERAEKVIFVITTDGLENASKRFGYEKIRRMIEREKEQYSWEFLFLGANMDAVKEAAPYRP